MIYIIEAACTGNIYHDTEYPDYEPCECCGDSDRVIAEVNNKSEARKELKEYFSGEQLREFVNSIDFDEY